MTTTTKTSTTSTKTITVRTWGSGAGKDLGVIRVRVPSGADREDCVQASIERRTGLKLGTWSGEGTALENGRPVAHHYQGALVRGCKGGGASVEGTIWASVPIN